MRSNSSNSLASTESKFGVEPNSVHCVVIELNWATRYTNRTVSRSKSQLDDKHPTRTTFLFSFYRIERKAITKMVKTKRKHSFSSSSTIRVSRTAALVDVLEVIHIVCDDVIFKRLLPSKQTTDFSFLVCSKAL